MFIVIFIFIFVVRWNGISSCVWWDEEEETLLIGGYSRYPDTREIVVQQNSQIASSANTLLSNVRNRVNQKTYFELFDRLCAGQISQDMFDRLKHPGFWFHFAFHFSIVFYIFLIFYSNLHNFIFSYNLSFFNLVADIIVKLSSQLWSFIIIVLIRIFFVGTHLILYTTLHSIFLLRRLPYFFIFFHSSIRSLLLSYQN